MRTPKPFLLTLATDEQVDHYFGGRAKKVKKPKNPLQLVPFSWNQPSMDGATIHTLTLPVLTRASNANMNRHVDRKYINRQKNTVLVALQTQLRHIDRERIRELTLTRISPRKLDEHDNLRQAFKHVVDILCAWIVCGDEAIPARKLGAFDNQLIGTGRITCNYEQTTDEHNRHLQGIQIRIRLGRKRHSHTTTSSTRYTTPHAPLRRSVRLSTRWRFARMLTT